MKKKVKHVTKFEVIGLTIVEKKTHKVRVKRLKVAKRHEQK